ncbi:hypothetical protein GOP47_0016237 [Adiantum capillus-veneris]|uniref:Serine/arginine-rich splicing factor 4 n=1 Tax=Adiantum capillus-veneris TaxID=13818 RepID=A0A9D4UHP9_ADICA|nr:hypothetical protein GOP47_0016237 [Adiantum capillus-veneris]
MSSLFVGNLSSHIRHRELENAFKRFGRCSLELKEGFGFVVYEDHRDAKRALEALQGRSICGEQPSISWAKKRRPFQRFPFKENFAGRERYHSRRRPPLEAEDGRRDEKFVDEMKGSLRASEARDESARSTERDAEWKDSGHERSVFDEEAKDADTLDSGRWDPHMEGSPDNTLVDRLLEDEHHHSDGKDKEDETGSVHEKSQAFPRDQRNKHHERSSRIYHNATEQLKRGRDTFGGRQQERCYNCGQSGHVKRQCRSRPRRLNVHSRESGYDGRRNDFRYPSTRGGFRGMGGSGRFRGSNGSRRILTRDVEPGYVRRTSRRHDVDLNRKYSDSADTKTREKSRRRPRRSESPKDSSSRERSKRKHKKSRKKSTRITKKRQRSSSGSPSSSQSPSSTSSSRSPSKSRLHSASMSESSKSVSHSFGSGSRSRSSDLQSSKSRSSSASSSSRSRSASARSRNSVSKSRSQSPLSQSPGSHVISSLSPKAKMTSSPRSSAAGGSQSSTSQGKEAYEIPIDDDDDRRHNTEYLTECEDVEQHDAKRSERRRIWSREAKKQKIQSRSDEEPLLESVPPSNGRIHGAKSIEANTDQDPPQQGSTVNNSASRGSESLKLSEAILGQARGTECNMFLAIMKQGGREAGASQDWGNLKFGAARLWPWEAMLCRRFKRGPISTANYERRKAQNEEFGIKDTFVRSSSGWWENHSE